MRRTLLVLLTVFAASSIVSCSGAEKAKTSEVAGEEVVEKAVEAPETPPDQGDGIAWADKSDEQKKAYMKLTVKPQMAKLFSDFDGEKFAELKCSTCHGPGTKEGKFDMPNPELPKLTDWEKLGAEKPEMMEFMKTKVVPEMAMLLGQEPFDPETKTGFGCMGCHTN